MRNSRTMSAFLENRWQWIAAIAALTIVTFGTVVTADFVLWDDTLLITSNPVIRGFTLQNFIRAFSTYDPELYIPLTFLTYQIEYSMAGLQPAIYHMSNLILHAANASLVALLLFALSRNRAGALLGGFLFAIHPLQTEAVAWASSRKDLLSTFFFLLSLLAYLRYREEGEKRPYYLSLVFFTLSLLSKVVSVTMPILLLLLDWLEGRKWDKRQFAEKAPFFLLSVVFGVVALFGKRMTAEIITPLELLLVAGKSAVFYLQKLVWPSGLTIVYPLEGAVTPDRIDLLLPWAGLIALITLALLLIKKTRVPAFAAVWYLLTLAPTFTNIAKGNEIYFASDRYAYIPLIGILVLLISAVDGVVRHWPAWKSSLVTACSVWIVSLSFLSFHQAATWHDSLTLLEHAIAVSPRSFAAHINLAVAYRHVGKTAEAKEILNAAKLLQEDHAIYQGLAAVSYREGDLEGALRDLRTAQAMNKKRPDADIPYGFGLVYMQMGNLPDAVKAYRDALAIEPNHSGARNNLAAVLLQMGDLEGARQEYAEAVKRDPTFGIGHYNLGVILQELGKIPEAIESYEAAIHHGGKQFDVLSRLGPLLVQNGRINEGISVLQEALKMNPSDAAFLQEALTSLQSILEKDPQHKKALHLLQWMMDRGLVKSR